MIPASTVKATALSLVGERYKLGEEPFGYVVGTEQTKDPNDVDCSGIIYGVFRKAGVLVNGRPLARLTAHDYWRMTNPISYAAATRVGDLAFQIRGNRVYHVTMVIDKNGLMIEAGNHGPNNRYPGSGYIGTLTKAQMQARGGVLWGRWATNIQQEDDMTEAQVRKLVKEMLAAEREMVWSDTVKRDQQTLVREGIISAPRDEGKLASVAYVDSLLARVLSKALGR